MLGVPNPNAMQSSTPTPQQKGLVEHGPQAQGWKCGAGTAAGKSNPNRPSQMETSLNDPICNRANASPLKGRQIPFGPPPPLRKRVDTTTHSRGRVPSSVSKKRPQVHREVAVLQRAENAGSHALLWLRVCGGVSVTPSQHKHTKSSKWIHSGIVTEDFHFVERAAFDRVELRKTAAHVMRPLGRVHCGINGWCANRYPNAPGFRKIVSALNQVRLIQLGHSALIQIGSIQPPRHLVCVYPCDLRTRGHPGAHHTHTGLVLL